MPVYHSLKTIFIRVPKTASTSIGEKLQTLDAHARYFTPHGAQKKRRLILEGYKHEGITEIKEKIAFSDFEEYYKVGFVRNPWDWLVSCYFYYQTTNLTKLGALVEGRMTYNNADPEIYMIRDIKNYSFDDFITFVEEKTQTLGPGANLNQLKHPYQPQYKYLVDNNEKLSVDFVGKYENLQKDWQLVCDHLELCQHSLKSLRLNHFNEGSHENYRKYYNNNTIERVYNIYKQDIELFNYKF